MLAVAIICSIEVKFYYINLADFFLSKNMAYSRNIFLSLCLPRFLNTPSSRIDEIKPFFMGSRIPELKNRVTDYDVIKRSCDVIVNFS